MSNKNKKKRAKVAILVDCNCGMKHRVILGLGELQILERSVIKGKSPDLHIHIETYAPTGRTLGNGQPEYVQFIPERKEVSPLQSSSRKEKVT